jgi:autotransporter translocation and assembly factor TamB
VVGSHRRLAITLLGATGLLLGVLLVGSWLAVRVWGPSLTAGRIAAAIQEATGRPAHVEEVALQPLLGRVRIGGLSAAGDNDLLVRVARIDVAIRIESVWRRELVVGATASGADVRIRSGPRRTEPVAFEIPERLRLGPITVRLASIAVEQSRLSFEDPPHRVAIGVDGLSATGRPDRGGLELTARADALRLTIEHFRETVQRVRAAGRIDAAHVLVHRLETDDPHHALEAAGSIEAPWSRDPTIAVEGTARLAAARIARALGATIAIDGPVAAGVTVAGPLDAAVLTARLRSEKLTVAGVAVHDVAGTVRLDDRALDVSAVEGRVLGGRLRGSINIPAARPGDTVTRVRLDDVDATALARLRGEGPDVRGRIALDAEARGDLARPRGLAGRVRVEATGVALPGDLARLGTGRVQATARMADGQGVAEAEARWPSASVTATARLEADDRVRVEARSRIDLAVLPGWAAGDALEVAARGEGRWPKVVVTAGIDLSRPAAGRDPGKVELRLDPDGGTTPRWSGSVRSRRLALPWIGIDDLLGALAVSADALDVARLTARAGGIPVTASGRWMWRGQGEARLVAGPAALARIPGVPPDLALDGSARVQVDATFAAAGIQATAQLEAERVSVAKIALGRGTGEAAVQGRRLDAALRFPERQLEMTARGDLSPGQVIAARMSLRSFDLASLAPPRPGEASPLRGSVSVGADLAIAIDAPAAARGRIAIEPATIAVAGTPWTSATAVAARLEGQRATLEPVRLTGPAGVLAASGVIWDAGAPSLVNAQLDVSRLATLAPAAGVDGRLQARVELSGDAGAVAGTRARASVGGEGLTLPGGLARLGTGTARVEMQLADRAVGITRGEVAFPGLAAAVTGRIGLDGAVALDARATAQGAPIGAALGVADSDGTLTARATIGGRLGQLDGQAQVSSERIAVAGIAVERLDAAARVQGETVRLQRFTARVLGAPVRASGEWAMSGNGRAAVEAGPLALARVPAPPALALGGALSLRAEAATARGVLTARARVETTDTRAAGLALGAGHLTARIDGRRLEASMDLGDRRISGSAKGALDPGGVIDAALDVAPLDVGPALRHLASRSDIDVGGSVAARLTARVPWDRPAAARARAHIEPLVLRAPRAGFDARGRIDARWENGVLTLEQAELSGTAGTARASGGVDSAGRLDVKVDARMSLAALLAPVTDVEGAAGTVAVQAHVTGTPAEPSIRGDGVLTGGRIAIRGFPTPLRDITARIAATPGALRLIDASAALGGGSLRAAGEAAVAGRALGLYRVRVTGRDVPLRPIEGLDTIWNADLELSGTGARALLSGEARLVRGYYGRDLISLSALAGPAHVAGPTPEVGLPLSIRALLDDNLVVRTAQARLRVGGTLTIRGTTAAPVVLGVIEAHDGTLVLRGNRYQLERAAVRFADPRRIDPTLDVTATTRIRDYDVTMRLTGRVQDLDMRLTSSPSLPRDQLLSLVAFGTTAESETGKAAGGAFAGEAASLVIRELLDLSGGGDSTVPGPLRTIMERTRVSYTHNSEDVGRFGLRIEYEVAGPFLLAGERTSQGYYLIDGVVRLRFR